MKIKDGKKVYDNFSHVEGWLYDSSKLAFRETGASSKNPGTKYIGGSIDIATNDELTNIVTVNFTYELPTFNSGKENARYGMLSDIINGTYKSVLDVGKDNATVLKIDGRIDVNEYYSDKSGEKRLVSFKMNNGGFIHTITASQLHPRLDKRSTFMTDILINNVQVKDADEEKGLPMKGIVNGFIFDYAGRLLPVSFEVVHPDAIPYFEGLGASNKNPVLTKISGVQTNEIVKRQIESSSAWGTEVREVENTNRSWRITWAQPETYEFDTPETLTAAELKEAITARKTRESELSAQFDQRNAKASAIPAAANGGFDF